MRASPRHSRIDPLRNLGTRVLGIGFAAIAALAVLILSVAALEVRRVERSTLQAADEIQHSIYHLANVAEELARLRSHIALGVTETRRSFELREQRISRILARLNKAIDQAPTTLGLESLARWLVMRPEIIRLQRAYAEAAAAIAEGKRQRAAQILAREVPAESAIQDKLDELEHEHRAAVLSRLRGAHRRASSLISVEILLAAAFLVGTVGVFAVMLGILRGQQRRIIDYMKRLEVANEDLDAFAGRVAHDLRNALGPIVIAPGLLREYANDPERVRMTADRTERSSRRAVAIVEALLAFSRAARDIDVSESGSLRAAVDDVLEELAPLAARLDVSFELGDIPDTRVLCSSGLLHVVLANVCGNAVKYLEGRAVRRVRISARLDDGGCLITVDDTGPGIPEQARDKIFEPFYRVADGRVPGLGLGLATVRRILDARGGRITVESELGRGSRFAVWIPLAETGSSSDRAAP